jgi:tRNA-dihydrouridine synthase B
MRIGSFSVSGRLIAAPMAGVTDRPFRSLCRRLGASFAISEMVSSNPRLRSTDKSRLRIDHAGESEPRWVQIAGTDPREMAEATRYNADAGAQIIDINMGCPAKKVCNRAAGSALLSDEPLIARILDAVVAASPVPVTLKIRTGPEPANRNGVRVARIAERAGVAAISVHGRSRACAFRGRAEHDTARRIKSAVKMPVIANGDISSPEGARQVLQQTGADALMIGRASQGNPWIFREVSHYLTNGTALPGPKADEVGEILVEHLEALHDFYGGAIGVRVARKHLSWYLKPRVGGAALWSRINRVEDPTEQLLMVRDFFQAETGQLAASSFSLGENAP